MMMMMMMMMMMTQSALGDIGIQVGAVGAVGPAQFSSLSFLGLWWDSSIVD